MEKSHAEVIVARSKELPGWNVDLHIDGTRKRVHLCYCHHEICAQALSAALNHAESVQTLQADFVSLGAVVRKLEAAHDEQR